MAFCTSRLRSVPGAATADRPGPYGGGRGGRARRAGIETNDPATRDALEACGMLYSAASVPALRLLRGYVAARSWGAARAAAAHRAGRHRVRGHVRGLRLCGWPDGRRQPRVRPALHHGHRPAQQGQLTGRPVRGRPAGVVARHAHHGDVAAGSSGA